MKTYPTTRNIQINNSSGYVNIPGNTTYSISFSAPGLNNYDYAEFAYLYLVIHSYSSATEGAAWTVLVGALVGGTSGTVFGGIDFSNGLSWNWDNASKGFAWGSATGALSGAIGMGTSALASSAGYTGFSLLSLKFLANGIASVGFSAFETMLEGEKWTVIRASTSFALGGLGSLFGSGIFSSIAWSVAFALTEGGAEEVFDYYSLTTMLGPYTIWQKWRFVC